MNLKEANTRAIEMSREVKIPDPQKVSRQYSHELSGGMAQRAMIAMMLAAQPKLLIADEPTSALDVSVQAQILNLLERLKKELGLTYLFISHDLSVIKYMSDQVAVMYLGKVAETGPAEAIFENPLHPYSQILLSAIPSVDPDVKQKKVLPSRFCSHLLSSCLLSLLASICY